MSKIRDDHIARYEWAAQQITHKRVIDAGCGVGYGSFIVGEFARDVRGLEIDRPTVEFARKHWSRDNVAFKRCDISSDDFDPGEDLDACLAFESIEHLEFPERFLCKLPSGCVLLGSVPNEDVVSFDACGNRHHFRHYSPDEIEGLLQSCGFSRVNRWLNQNKDRHIWSVEPQGRTLIFRAVK